MLEGKWPEKYNAVGHLRWDRRIYEEGPVRRAVGVGKESTGHLGQRTVPVRLPARPGTGSGGSCDARVAFVFAVLATLCVLGSVWRPLLLSLPLLALAVGARLVQVGLTASGASFTGPTRSRVSRWKLFGLTAFLHLTASTGAPVRTLAPRSPGRWRDRSLATAAADDVCLE